MKVWGLKVWGLKVWGLKVWGLGVTGFGSVLLATWQGGIPAYRGSFPFCEPLARQNFGFRLLVFRGLGFLVFLFSGFPINLCARPVLETRCFRFRDHYEKDSVFPVGMCMRVVPEKYIKFLHPRYTPTCLENSSQEPWLGYKCLR